MAVLTSPPRTRPRFGPQAGLVAATRGVAFAGLMLAGLGLLIVIAASVFLTALGAGVLIAGNSGPQDQHKLLALVVLGTGLGLTRFAVPPALLGIRGLARLTRQLAGEWCGVPIAEWYAPRPDEASSPIPNGSGGWRRTRRPGGTCCGRRRTWSRASWPRCPPRSSRPAWSSSSDPS